MRAFPESPDLGVPDINRCELAAAVDLPYDVLAVRHTDGR